MAEAQTPTSPPEVNEVFQAQYIPKQKGPTPADHPSMKAYISTYPPLGQVTLVDKSSTSVFTALLEVDESRAAEPWQISLWHSEGSEWHEVPMDPVQSEAAYPASLQSTNAFPSRLARLYYTTPLAINLPTNFTVKFRRDSDQPWKCIKDHQGIADGLVILKTVTDQTEISSSLEDYVEGLNPILKTKNYRSQSPGTTLWSIEAPVGAAVDDKSTVKDIMFGLPWGKGKFSR